MPGGNVDPCAMLEWDTAFFGFRVARVQGNALTPALIREIDEWCRDYAVRCLYFLARANDPRTIRLAESSGFRLVDVRVTLECANLTGAISAASVSGSELAVRRSCQQDIPMLQSISRECYHDSRFYYDEKFPRPLCAALYETWIKLSCEDCAAAVLVAETGNLPVGYVSCHLGPQPGRGNIGLVGVSRQARGRGAGRVLVHAALCWFATQGVRKISVVTQGRNAAAQRLYERCGFIPDRRELWYHRWPEWDSPTAAR